MKTRTESRRPSLAHDADCIPLPKIILFGCTPFAPHKPKSGPCPTCAGRIGKCPGVSDEIADVTYCARCDALSPANQVRVNRAKRGITGKEASRLVEQDAARELERKARKAILNEDDRRRLWNGYKGGLLEPLSKVTNRAKVGREFLISINQVPDWSLILDTRGRVVGRKPTVEAAPAEPQDAVLATV